MIHPDRVMIGGGLVLVMIGLVSGLLVPSVSVERLGLAAHLAAVTNGVLLIAIGAIWHHVRLSRRLGILAVSALLYGTYANWFSVQLASIWDAGQLLKIANPTPTAAPWQELIVNAGLLSLSLAMIVGVGLVLMGFRRSRPVGN